MASTTIYPFGTGGSLPSNIGIINDLSTGGADKALAAEQGKVIGDYLFGNPYDVDLSGVTISNYSLGSSKTWNAGGKHSVVPVTPGEKIWLEVTESPVAGGGWYGFLTSTYTPPSSNSSIPLVTGTDRVWLNKSAGKKELTVPEGAAYLCYCPQDGTGSTASWALQKMSEPGMKEDYPSEATIVDVVDVDAITEKICSLGSNGRWLLQTNQLQRHKVIPVTPGMTVMVKAKNSTNNGNFLGWLTSSYTPPTANNQVIPYAGGSGRISQNDSSGWVERVAPAESAYLCLVTVNGDNYTTDWEVKRYINTSFKNALENYSLYKHDVIDNCKTGGVTSPFSAEQGKKLYEMVTGGGIPLGLTKVAYEGAPVNPSKSHYVAAKQVASIGNLSYQGGACFGDYLFLFTNNNATCYILNLATSTLLQTYSIPSADRGFVSNCHCNTVNFGTEYYDENDPFPLIYVSTGYSDGTDTGALVYRIVATTESDVTTYALALVQTLKMPGTGWTEFVVGADGDCYLCYTSTRTIYRMKMPKLSEGDLTFDLEDAIGVYQFTSQPAWYNGSRNQNRMYHNGKIYLVSGVPESDEKALFIVLDLATQTREVEIDLSTLGFTAEPETTFLWNGAFCIAFRMSSGVFALYFE